MFDAREQETNDLIIFTARCFSDLFSNWLSYCLESKNALWNSLYRLTLFQSCQPNVSREKRFLPKTMSDFFNDWRTAWREPLAQIHRQHISKDVQMYLQSLIGLSIVHIHSIDYLSNKEITWRWEVYSSLGVALRFSETANKVSKRADRLKLFNGSVRSDRICLNLRSRMFEEVRRERGVLTNDDWNLIREDLRKTFVLQCQSVFNEWKCPDWWKQWFWRRQVLFDEKTVLFLMVQSRLTTRCPENNCVPKSFEGARIFFDRNQSNQISRMRNEKNGRRRYLDAGTTSDRKIQRHLSKVRLIRPFEVSNFVFVREKVIVLVWRRNFHWTCPND